MRKDNKIKAFTLSEMIVVLILTSIVVALAFTVLSLVQRYMFSIQANLKEQTEINKLETSLCLDFNRYNTVTYNAIENELHFANQLEKVSYKIHQDFIVKEIDTFQLKVTSKTVYFDGEITNKGILDAIKLTVNEKLRSKNIFAYKKNDAVTYMK